MVLWLCLSVAAVGSVLGFVVLWSDVRLLGLPQYFECVFLPRSCTIRVLIALVRLVLLVRLASEVWKSILSWERKSFQARTCWGPVSCSSSFGNSLAQSGNRWSNLHRHVFDRCGILCSLVPFHFVKCPEFAFQGHVLGHTILDLCLWGWIAGFNLLLIVNMSRTRQSLWTSETYYQP